MFITLQIKGNKVTLDNVSVGSTVFIRVNNSKDMIANDTIISWVTNTFKFSSSDEVIIKGVRDALLAGFSQQAKVDREIFVD
jgi:hypothetical protein